MEPLMDRTLVEIGKCVIFFPGVSQPHAVMCILSTSLDFFETIVDRYCILIIKNVYIYWTRRNSSLDGVLTNNL